jgi:Domain of unknown function (DUF4160)
MVVCRLWARARQALVLVVRQLQDPSWFFWCHGNACIGRLIFSVGSIIVRMPTVFRYKGFRFFFYSNEGSPREPLHVHVMGAGGDAKFWLHPLVSLAGSDGLDARTLRELLRVVEDNVVLIERAWNEHFSDSRPL